MQSRKVLATFIALMLSFGFGLTPLSATAPEPEFDGPFVEDKPLFDCGGFTVLLHTEGYFWLNKYFGKDGNLTRFAGHVSGVDRLSNSTNSAKYVEGKFAWNYRYDVVKGEETRTGAFYHIVLPGYGPVYVESGRWGIVDGQWVSKGGLSTLRQDVICAALE